MDVTNATLPGLGVAGAGSASSAALIDSDFQTFLVLLTTQMQNQDPLNPIDSTDYAAQLATFSGVEQQVRTNGLLELLSAQIGLTSLAQFSGWVGMEARSTAPVHFDTTPLTLYPSPASGADQVVVVAYDDQNREVSRSVAPVSSDPLSWAGTDDQGQPLAPGTYSFRLESYAGGQLISVSQVEAFSLIREVRNGAYGSVLVTEAGTEIAPDQITALRQPATPTGSG
ncbi:MAG: flagellar hook assembly protein FlgD [Rhodobacteraceae bacterium]|nr:flagellar hook assembly protein FlgD [Paracoccaceae bacterium]